MTVRELILKNRSYRRFVNPWPVSRDELLSLVDLARLSPSGRNAQTLKYILSTDPHLNTLIFPTLSWAGYLKDWGGPAENERPTAYIIMLNDTEIATNYFWDHGIAAQSILLGAVEVGLGGCMIASVNREKLRNILKLPDRYDIVQVIALGKPAENIVLEPMKEDGDYKYWRDTKGNHHVPKRLLSDIVLP